MTIKLYEIKSKQFQAIQWLGDNKKDVSEFALYLINFENDDLFIMYGSCAGHVSVGDWLVKNKESMNILKYDAVDFENEYELVNEES